MNGQKRHIGKLLLRSAIELVGVVALVFGIGWCSVRLAEAAHGYPVRPTRGGTIELRIAKSDRKGEVTFEEGEWYAGWWHCRGDWTVDWRVAPAVAGDYHVEVRAGSGSKKPERIKVTIGGQTLETETSGTELKTASMGLVRLKAVPYKLTVQPAGPEIQASCVNLKSVTLRPGHSQE